MSKRKKRKPKDRLGEVENFLSKLNPVKRVTDAALRIKAKHFTTLAAAFANKNPETLMILLDPKTDVFYMSYDKYQVPLLMKDEKGNSMKIVKGAMLFNAETMAHATETDYLLGIITSALNSIRILREKRFEKEKRSYSRIIKDNIRPGELEKKAKKEAKEQEKIEKTKRTRARIMAEKEQEEIAKEQEEINKPKDN